MSKANLIEELGKLGFTKSELEEVVGTTTDNIIWTVIKKRKRKTMLVAKKEDIVETYNTLRIGSPLTVLKKVYEVTPAEKYITKKITQIPGVMIDTSFMYRNVTAYILNNGKIKEKSGLWKPEEEELKKLDVTYIICESGEEESTV